VPADDPGHTYPSAGQSYVSVALETDSGLCGWVATMALLSQHTISTLQLLSSSPSPCPVLPLVPSLSSCLPPSFSVSLSPIPPLLFLSLPKEKTECDNLRARDGERELFSRISTRSPNLHAALAEWTERASLLIHASCPRAVTCKFFCNRCTSYMTNSCGTYVCYADPAIDMAAIATYCMVLCPVLSINRQ